MKSIPGGGWATPPVCSCFLEMIRPGGCELPEVFPDGFKPPFGDLWRRDFDRVVVDRQKLQLGQLQKPAGDLLDPITSAASIVSQVKPLQFRQAVNSFWHNGQTVISQVKAFQVGEIPDAIG